MEKFKIFINNTKEFVVPEISKFPGGEVKVLIPNIEKFDYVDVRIEAMLFSSDDIMALAMIKNALKGMCFNIRLTMPYIPYARQDRICNVGEAFSLEVFADMINSMNFDSVLVYDAHSSVSTSLIDRCINVPSEDLMVKNDVAKWLDYRKGDKIYLISPDAGSVEKSKAIKAKFPEITDIIYAVKLRDPKTGNITGTIINNVPEDINESYCIICDDICDGGRTFIEITNTLKRHNNFPKELVLYVTHGIFSRGYDDFYAAGFSILFSTINFHSYE